MNKIEKVFTDKGLKFIGYITIGYPDYNTSLKWADMAVNAGVDILEIGFPFSDPVADGVTIQHASQIALEKGMNKNNLISWIKDFRKSHSIPLIIMSYYNPIYHNGNLEFIMQLNSIGVNGVIIPDLPNLEGSSFYKELNKNKIATPMLIPPNINEKDSMELAKKSSGFIYFVSKTGTTGESSHFHRSLITLMENVKKQVNTPIALGFGIKDSNQVTPFRGILDGIIVGSNLINRLEKGLELKNWIEKIKGSE